MTVSIIAGTGVGLRECFKKASASITLPTEGCGNIMEDTALREKVASKMLDLQKEVKEYEKQAHAIRVLYKQAELGLCAIPCTYNEFEQKVASLGSQDLAVVEKALELSAGNVKLGELSGNSDIIMNAAVQFQNEIMDPDA